MTLISLKELDKATVLAALYNASAPQGMGFMHYDPDPMTVEEATELLEHYTYFDYLKGRVMKVDLSGDTLNTRLYDRDNGVGAAEAAITAFLSKQHEAIQETHETRKGEAATLAQEGMDEESRLETTHDMAAFRLGLADVADILGPAIEKALEEDK